MRQSFLQTIIYFPNFILFSQLQFNFFLILLDLLKSLNITVSLNIILLILLLSHNYFLNIFSLIVFLLLVILLVLVLSSSLVLYLALKSFIFFVFF